MSKKTIRALEQLIKDNYENLTFGEMCEYDLDCSFCPMHQTYCFCEGGMTCYGGVPIEPMCCSFNEDDTLQDIYDGFVSKDYAQTKAEEEREKQQKLKEEKSKQRKQKLFKYKMRNAKELDQIKILKLKIKKQEKLRNEAINCRIWLTAKADIDKIFKNPDETSEKLKCINDTIFIYDQNINNFKIQISKIKEVIAKSEKEFKKVKYETDNQK